MRTTINLKPGAYDLVRALAAISEKSIGEVLSEACLRLYLPSSNLNLCFMLMNSVYQFLSLDSLSIAKM